MAEVASADVTSVLFFHAPMQEVTPKVVAMAVSTVITMVRILLQSVLLSIVCYVLEGYSSNPELSSSSVSFTYLIGTLLKVKVSSAPANTFPGRKLIFARLMRFSV